MCDIAQGKDCVLIPITRFQLPVYMIYAKHNAHRLAKKKIRRTQTTKIR